MAEACIRDLTRSPAGAGALKKVRIGDLAGDSNPSADDLPHCSTGQTFGAMWISVSRGIAAPVERV